jgi:dTDP-4-amino-4,6-dideoxygalactose transaminase
LGSVGIEIVTTRNFSRSRLIEFALLVIWPIGESSASAPVDFSMQMILPWIHYPLPVHLQKAFAHLGYWDGNGDLSITETLCQRYLSLAI